MIRRLLALRHGPFRCPCGGCDYRSWHRSHVQPVYPHGKEAA